MHIEAIASKDNRFTGRILRADAVVARIEDDVITECSSQAPLHLQHRKDFNEWLVDRAADLSRSNVRIILKVLGLPLQDAIATAKSVHAATITDSFWIRKDSEGLLKYSDVIFQSDLYALAALKGDPNIFTLPKTHSPELTNIGSFNKGWVRSGNQ